MIKTTSLLSAMVLAGAGLVSQGASAADVSNPVEAIELVDNSAYFGALFTGNNSGNTFTDKYTFSTFATGALTADLSSVSGNAKNGLDITGFGLYDSMGALVLTGTQLSGGIIDSWMLTADNLAAGNYYVEVTGSVLSNAAGKYFANVALAPVPEPETYGMMLGGLGLLGFMARRRKQQGKE